MEYPVEWKGKTYPLSDLTIGKKKSFCEWLIKHLRSEAIADMRHDRDLLDTYLDGLRRRVWWVEKEMSPAVADALRSPDGGLQYNRILFGDCVKPLSDDELQALIDSKDSDETSDYSVALRAIHEDANPKVYTPASGSGPSATTPTEPS
jgi:hypothetical protein